MAPRLVVLSYLGDAEHPEEVVAVVGKGVTFDTGGLNLKPTGSIENMHMDKGGAAAVLAAADVIAASRLKVNVGMWTSLHGWRPPTVVLCMVWLTSRAE